MKNVSGCAAIVFSLLVISGCGGGEDVDLPEVTPVTGVLTLDGKPVEGASIIFQPANITAQGDTKKYGARATSDAQGKYTAMTYYSAGHDLKGIVPGEYVIAVVKMGEATAPQSHEAKMKNGPPTPQMGGAAGHGASGPKNILPKQYSDATTSGFRLEVKSGEPQTFDIKLKSK